MSRPISRQEEKILRARRMVRLVEAALFAVYYADASSKFGRSGQKFKTARECCSSEDELDALLVLHRDWKLFASKPGEEPGDEDKAVIWRFKLLFKAAGVEVPPVEDEMDEEAVPNPLKKGKKPAARKPKKGKAAKKPSPGSISTEAPHIVFMGAEKRVLRDALRTAPGVRTWRDLESRLGRVEPKFGVGGLVFGKIARRFSLTTVLQARGISEMAIVQLCSLAELPKEQFGDGAVIPAVTPVFRGVEVLPTVMIVAAPAEPEEPSPPTEPEVPRAPMALVTATSGREAANLPLVHVSTNYAAVWRNIRRLQMVLENGYNWPHGVGVPTQLCIRVVEIYYNTINPSQYLTKLGYAGLLRRQPRRLNQSNHLWEVLDANVSSRDYTTDVGRDHLEQTVRAFLYNNRYDVLALFPDVRIPESPYKTA